MNSAPFSPAHRSPRSPRRGASALGPETTAHRRHILGDALRAIRVYLSTAFRVAVLGEYVDRSPVIRT
ncbi:hypothetical protein AB0C51_16590 [Streptomyces pathocidini]|uniref:Uncharacterized protein n=1 Tax=Streptomyces pathocidini TaxID=1650571 RepID=A0ABW7UWS6_9ACTN|nr:hypothetical protein [Streptomyces pathocidini]